MARVGCLGTRPCQSGSETLGVQPGAPSPGQSPARTSASCPQQSRLPPDDRPRAACGSATAIVATTVPTRSSVRPRPFRRTRTGAFVLSMACRACTSLRGVLPGLTQAQEPGAERAATGDHRHDHDDPRCGFPLAARKTRGGPLHNDGRLDGRHQSALHGDHVARNVHRGR